LSGESEMDKPVLVERHLGKIIKAFENQIIAVVVVDGKTSGEFPIYPKSYGKLAVYDEKDGLLKYSRDEMSRTSKCCSVATGDHVLLDIDTNTCHTIRWRKATPEEIAIYA
jgi:hypothetical protein